MAKIAKTVQSPKTPKAEVVQSTPPVGKFAFKGPGFCPNCGKHLSLTNSTGIGHVCGSASLQEKNGMDYQKISAVDFSAGKFATLDNFCDLGEEAGLSRGSIVRMCGADAGRKTGDGVNPIYIFKMGRVTKWVALSVVQSFAEKFPLNTKVQALMTKIAASPNKPI